MSKKYIKFLSGLVLSVVLFPQAFAGVATPCGPNETNCWQCGDDCSARLDQNGKLSIYGSGAMYDYNYTGSTGYGNTFTTTAPWANKIGEITSAEVLGVSTIGAATFLGFKRLTNINIGDSVTSIGTWGLEDCNFSNLYIPASVTTIGPYALALNQNLENFTLSSSTSLGYNLYGDPITTTPNVLKYKEENNMIYLYDEDNNIKGVFNNQSELKDVVNGTGQAHIEYGEDKSFTVYNYNGEITGKWDSHGDVIARYVKGTDGSTSIYNGQGKLIGLQGKRILTVDEATALVSGNKNMFILKYR